MDELKLSENNTINMHNILARASQGLNPTELKIIRLAVSKIYNTSDKDVDVDRIQKDFIDTDNFTNENYFSQFPRINITVSAYEYSRIYNTKISYPHLKEAINKIYDRSINIKLKNRIVRFRWINKAEYLLGKGDIILSFSEYVYPFLNQLSKNFSSYPLKKFALLKKLYSMRLFEIGESWINHKGAMKISVEDFRHAMQIPPSFKWGNIRQRCIDSPISEIESKTDMRVSYELYKPKGKTVDSIIFKFRRKKTKTIDSIKTQELKEKENNNKDTRKLDQLIDTSKENNLKYYTTRDQKITYIRSFKGDSLEKIIKLLLGDFLIRNHVFDGVPISQRETFLRACFNEPDDLKHVKLSHLYTRIKELSD